MDRRVVFFVVAAAACAALASLATPDHRWVALLTAAAYLVLALLSGLDAWSRRRDAARLDTTSGRHDG